MVMAGSAPGCSGCIVLFFDAGATSKTERRWAASSHEQDGTALGLGKKD